MVVVIGVPQVLPESQPGLVSFQAGEAADKRYTNAGMAKSRDVEFLQVW